MGNVNALDGTMNEMRDGLDGLDDVDDVGDVYGVDDLALDDVAGNIYQALPS